MDVNINELKGETVTLSLLRKSGADPVLGYVPALYFNICLADGTVIGKCDLRCGHNENTFYGGNIGYTIKEEYRGHRYASMAVKLLLSLARDLSMEYVLITCSENNIASQKTCESAGGEYMGLIDIPEHNEMYKLGRRKSMQFRFDLK